MFLVVVLFWRVPDVVVEVPVDCELGFFFFFSFVLCFFSSSSFLSFFFLFGCVVVFFLACFPFSILLWSVLDFPAWKGLARHTQEIIEGEFRFDRWNQKENSKAQFSARLDLPQSSKCITGSCIFVEEILGLKTQKTKRRAVREGTLRQLAGFVASSHRWHTPLGCKIGQLWDTMSSRVGHDL